MSTAEQLYAAAMTLEREDREMLTLRLNMTLALDPKIEAAWDAEIARRLEADTGDDEVPWEDVRDRLLAAARR